MTIYRFDHKRMIQRIVIVGCGGTGAQITRSVARILYDMRDKRMRVPDLCLYDPDMVEAKNIGRQLFTAGDIGKNKAEVLMRRFNAALGLDISVCPTAFTAQEFGRRNNYHRDTLLIGAVDSHEGRIEMAKCDCVWIDCGNHRSSGQVVIGNTDNWSKIKKQKPEAGPRVKLMTPENFVANGIGNEKIEPAYYSLSLLPNAAAMFPSLLLPEEIEQPTQTLSCAELVQIGDQDLLVNDWMATCASSYVYKMLRQMPIENHMTFIDTDGMNVKSYPISMDSLSQYEVA